jgi:hypothetical protein
MIGDFKSFYFSLILRFNCVIKFEFFNIGLIFVVFIGFKFLEALRILYNVWFTLFKFFCFESLKYRFLQKFAIFDSPYGGSVFGYSRICYILGNTPKAHF